MSHIANALTEMYRTQKHIKPVRTNDITKARVKQYEAIKSATGEDPTEEYNYSMQIVNDNLPQIQRYILSQNETPATKLTDTVLQAYKLRCNHINNVAKSMDVPQDEAEVWLEMEEADDMNLETSGADGYLGSLMAAIGVAATRLEQKKKKGLGYDPSYSEPDNLDAGIVGNVAGIVGNITTGAELKRAAQGKPAGIIGALSTGGTQHYDALRQYFKQNPNVAAQVLSGVISSETQLPNWGGGLGAGANFLNSNDITSGVADYQRKQQIKKMLPYIIGGVVLLIIVIILISKRGSSSK
jgi:hypothetical protein